MEEDKPIQEGPTYRDVLKAIAGSPAPALLNEQYQASNKFEITLEKGAAKKSIFDMSPEEIKVASWEVFEIVKLKAAEVGQQPIVSAE